MMSKFHLAMEAGDFKVDVLGFSRGAAMAREFVNRIHDEYPCMPIRWLGLFDTVSEYGWGGLRLSIPDTVQSVLQITAENEYRMMFPLISIRPGPGEPIQHSDWLEMSLPGAHSDIGGGYNSNRGIANWSLQIMRAHGLQHGVPFGPIPAEYLDISDFRPHDSRYWIDVVWGLIGGDTRKIEYFP